MKTAFVLSCLMTACAISLLTAIAFSSPASGPQIPGLPIGIASLVIAVAQWLAGFYLKKKPGVVNQVIPWVTMILGWIGYNVVPVDAGAAGFLNAGKIAGGLLLGTVQTILLTGFHEWVLHALVRPVQGKTSTATTYLGA